MDALITRYCISLLLLTSAIASNKTGSNETSSEELREPRVSGRIVKLYSGAKLEQYLCPGEGFQPDPKNCAIFYRCVKERSGKYTVFRYQCAPGTVYDPDVEVCNYPRNTRRIECGGTKKSSSEKFNTTPADVYESQTELPRPISTKKPFYTDKTTLSHPSTIAWALLNYPTTSQIRETNTILQSTKILDYTSKYQWASPSKPVTEYVPRLTSPINIHQSKSESGDQCTRDGFMGDSENCRKFYRCVGNQRGGFVRYEFTCTDLTVWDDEIEGCNHPWAVKRSKCGRSMSYADKSATKTTKTDSTTTNEPVTNYNGHYGEKTNKTIQQQTQISYGSKVTQTQTQISHSNEVIQNQTQIHYGNRKGNKKISQSKQNQTQISYASAVSQSQTQIDYGNKGVQTQTQIDHSKDSSQTQVQVQESTSSPSITTIENNNIGGNECTESGFMGDSNDCKKFYRCVSNGRGTYTKFQYVCGDGTAWDPSIEACNHIWAVKNCGGNAPIEPTTQKTTTTQTITTEYQTKPTTKSTTQNLQTIGGDEDDDDNDVGYNNQIDNQETSTSTTSTSTATKKPNGEKGTECKNSGFMGDDNDCKIFYRCVDNGNGGFTRYEFKCGDGTLWDPEIDACNHATAVKNCGNKSPSEPGSTSATAKPTEYPTESTKTTQNPSTTSQTTDETEGVGSSELSTHKTKTTTEKPSGSSTYCTSSGFLGDENDCKIFYRCVDDGKGGFTRYDFKCGDGTVWDPEIEACNHEWAVKKCGGGSINSENEYPTTKQEYPQNVQTTVTLSQVTTQSPPSNDDYDTGYGSHNDEPVNPDTTAGTTKQPTNQEQIQCTSSGFMGDQNDCKKFYRCVDNGNGGFTRYEFTCGEGTVWDPKIEACNHAWAVEKCGGTNSNENTGTTSSTTKLTTQSSSETTESTKETNAPTQLTSTTSSIEAHNKCSKSGFIDDGNDCKKFYRCVDNGDGSYIRYEFTCGDGTVWDPKIEACNHAWAVENCGSQFSDINKETTSQQPIMQDENQENGNPSQSHDDSESSATSTSSGVNEITGDECMQEGFFGNTKDCKKFYRCVDNGQGGFIKYDFTCGDGTVWNKEIQVCDHESADKTCSSSSSYTNETQYESTTSGHSTSKKPQSTTQVTQSSEATSGECTSEGFFAHSYDCKKFIRCVNNGNGGYTKYEFSCGDGTVWVQEIQACDHDNEITSCKSINEPVSQSNDNNYSSSTSKQTTSSSTESMIPEKENDDYESGDGKETDVCSSEGYFANTQDCTKFYRCVDNGNGGYTKYDFDCGEGTAWDSDIQTCNHINEVKSCSESNQENENSTNKENDTTTNKNESEEQSSTSSTTKPTQSSKEDTCESEGYYGNSNDCTKFYRCVDNGKGGYTKYDFTCGEGTIWDQDVTTCNHPGDVVNPSCSSSQESGSTVSSSTSAGSSSQTTSSSSTDSSESGSTESSTSESSESSSKKPSNQNVTCDKAGYYPNPDDCKKFYRCVDWDGDGKKFSVFHFECGEGTIWDPALDTCNYEESVYPPRDCSQTQSQSMGNETTTDETTTQESTTEQSTTESTTTQQSTSEQTTTDQTTTSEQTTTEQSTTSEQSTTEQTTTEQSTTSEVTTTQQSTTSEQSTTQQTTTSEQTTTEQSTTTQQSTTSEQTTDESSTTEQSTTEQTTEKTTDGTTTSEGTTEKTSDGTTEGGSDSNTEGTTEQSTTEQSTTEQTTTEQSTTEQSTTEQSTTEQSTTEQSTTEQSTTEQSTTEQSTTEQSTTEQSTTEQSTTEQSTTESTTDSSTTESSSSEKECPETDDDQYLLVCPTSFRRHPKYCNMFYQCTEDDDSSESKVSMFKCPNNTIYDESQTKCVEEDKADKKCNGEIANRRRFKRFGLNYREPIEADRGRQSCPNTGYFSFEKGSECSKGFLKCEKTKKGQLRGYVYQCPEGYIYWSISKRCELKNTVKDCKRSNNDWTGRWNIPVERKNIARK